MKTRRILIFLRTAMVLTIAALALVAALPSAGQKDGPMGNDMGKGQVVNCPVNEVRTQIATKLPIPWYDTPQVGRLERIRVATIGGSQKLVCEYWAYGRTVGVMREFPEGTTDCRPRPKSQDFICH